MAFDQRRLLASTLSSPSAPKLGSTWYLAYTATKLRWGHYVYPCSTVHILYSIDPNPSVVST